MVGSLAAFIQSLIGNVPASSLFAWAQRVAMRAQVPAFVKVVVKWVIVARVPTFIKVVVNPRWVIVLLKIILVVSLF